jgi:hypothetical protein
MGIRSMLFGRESARIDRGRECLARGDHYGALQQVAGLEHRDVTDIRTHALQGVRASIAC